VTSAVCVLQHLHAQSAYELQVSNLTRCVANLEDNLRQTDDDKNTLLSDLTAVRELCSRLEGTKESLQRQLTALTIDKEQVSVDGSDKKHFLMHLVTKKCFL